MSLHDKGHPFWTWLTHATYLLGMLGFMALNATTFDATELKTIAEVGVVAAGAAFLKHQATKDNKPKPDDHKWGRE